MSGAHTSRGGNRRTPRFHHDEALAVGTEILLGRERSRHLSGVLRARAGDTVCLFDGDGHDYLAELLEPGRAARLRVLSRVPNPSESPLAITLVQGVSRGERMDATVRQAVELGAHRIVPVLTRRAQVSLDAARAAKRLAHWQGIVVSACEQCGRSRVPELDPPQDLQTWLSGVEGLRGEGFVLAPDASLGLGEAPLAGTDATLLVGPESGLDPRETACAVAAGLLAVRFGPPRAAHRDRRSRCHRRTAIATRRSADLTPRTPTHGHPHVRRALALLLALALPLIVPPLLSGCASFPSVRPNRPRSASPASDRSASA